MCGICGYISKNKISDENLIKMNDTMIHRGPNDSGIWQGRSKEYWIGLAHRRLAILDLSEMGHQPMHTSDQRIHIVFNGEIYNFKEIRMELTELGHRFESECDTEVILKAYAQWKEKCVYKLDGMFAFAIFDELANEVFLARDRIGKKPLYYYWDANNFIFASELKAIVENPYFHKELNTEVIEEFLCNQYINEPNTIYKNTYKLPAGHCINFSSGTLCCKSYWSILDEYQNKSICIENDYQQAKNTLKTYLQESVAKRLVADVPVGTFLSGGIDSTLVTALANEQKPGVKTFTIGFDDKERNEAPYAKETASYLGTEHYELYVSEHDMLEMIQDIWIYYDEPFADPSQIPTMLVSRLAKENVTVVLSGDGGDEFFCGYSMYDYVYYAQKLDAVAGVGNSILRNSIGTALKRKFPQSAVALLENRDVDYKTQLFSDLPEKFVSKMIKNPKRKIKFDIEKKLKMDDWQIRRMILDMYTYLPEDVLTKADRASMKYSLEMRCPLLDTKVMEYSFCIPQRFKYAKGDKKHILKDILYDYVPKDMMDRPKNGFGVPLAKWLQTYLKDDVLRITQRDFIEKQGLFCYDKIQELISIVEKSDKKPYPKILWAYYIFQLWYIKNFEEA